MQTELFSLSKVFTENLFRIPDYQRGYSWGERQLKDFWNDLIQLDERRDHYTGVLTLEEVDQANFARWSDDLWIIESKRYKPYYVVDGQQRLTTSLILLQCILEAVGPDAELNYTRVEDIKRKFIFESRDKGISRSYVFGYEKDNPSYEYLKTRIFMERSDAHSIGEETIYTQNLSTAKAFFSEKLKSHDLKTIQDIYTKLTQHFLFNIYVISGAIDVFVTFETMNNRGKLLSHLELLKNRLIFLSTRLDVDVTERQRLRRVINESWKTAYHFLGRNQKRPLDDDHFLWVQFLLYAGTHQIAGREGKQSRALWLHLRSDTESYKSYLLDEYFTIRNIGSASTTDADQSTSQKLSAEILYQYAHDLKKSVETYYKVLNPEDSGFSDEIRVYLERLRRLGWRDALPIGVAAVSRGTPDNELLRLLQRLERLLFVQQIRFQYIQEQFDVFSLAVDIATGKESVEAVSNKAHDVVELIAKRLDLADITASWAKSRGYYGWRTLKYFLYEYEQEQKKKSRSNRDKIVWEDFVREDYENDYSTIEHIYPQKAVDSYWRDRFNMYSMKQRNAIRNSLGNLLAVSRPKNASLSNRAFPEKRDGNAESGGYRFGSYSEIEVADLQDWTPQEVLRRGIHLLGFLEKRWSLSVGDEAKKVAALKLGFLTSAGSATAESGDEPEEDVTPEQ